MNLYELNKEFSALEANLNRQLSAAVAEGSITQEQADDIYADTLEGASGDLEEKLLNIAKIAANLEAEAEAISVAIARQKARKDSLSKKSEALRKRAISVMQQHDLSPRDAEICLKLRKSEAVEIDDLSELPADYIREKVSKEADKQLIKKAIKDGFSVPGAHIESRVSLVIG